MWSIVPFEPFYKGRVYFCNIAKVKERNVNYVWDLCAKLPWATPATMIHKKLIVVLSKSLINRKVVPGRASNIKRKKNNIVKYMFYWLSNKHCKIYQANSSVSNWIHKGPTQEITWSVVSLRSSSHTKSSRTGLTSMDWLHLTSFVLVLLTYRIKTSCSLMSPWLV